MYCCKHFCVVKLFSILELCFKLCIIFHLFSDEIIRDRFDISPDLRNTITEIVSRKRAANTNIFNELQSTVKGVIASTSYQTFLTSEFFIRYVEEQERQYETKPSVSGANTTSAVNNTVSSNDADGAVGFTGMTIELSPLLPLSNLQTLHEDSELNFSEQSTMPKRMTARPMPKLTPELLLATEQGRLEVKPPGYVQIDSYFITSFNNVAFF